MRREDKGQKSRSSRIRLRTSRTISPSSWESTCLSTSRRKALSSGHLRIAWRSIVEAVCLAPGGENARISRSLMMSASRIIGTKLECPPQVALIVLATATPRRAAASKGAEPALEPEGLPPHSHDVGDSPDLLPQRPPSSSSHRRRGPLFRLPIAREDASALAGCRATLYADIIAGRLPSLSGLAAPSQKPPSRPEGPLS